MWSGLFVGVCFLERNRWDTNHSGGQRTNRQQQRINRPEIRKIGYRTGGRDWRDQAGGEVKTLRSEEEGGR